MTVVWTEHALRGLSEIEAYIAEDDPAAAAVFIDRLIGRTNLLKDQSLAGRLVPEVPGRELRESIEANYRIVYRVNGTVAEILTVFEAHKRFIRD